jgi:hypothetical protein
MPACRARMDVVIVLAPRTPSLPPLDLLLSVNPPAAPRPRPLQTYGSFDIDVLRTSLHNMRSADLNEMLLSGELAALTNGLPGLPEPGTAAAAAAGAHTEAPSTSQPVRQPAAGGAALAAARADRKRAASPAGLPRTSLDALMAPPPGLDLGAVGDGAKRARRSGTCARARARRPRALRRSGRPSRPRALRPSPARAPLPWRAAARAGASGRRWKSRALLTAPSPGRARRPLPAPGRVSALLMELDAPSVRGAFAAAHGRISSSGFELFDLGPGFPLGALHGGLGAALELASPTSNHHHHQQQQQQQHGRPTLAAAAAAPRVAAVAALPAALQPAPEELMRFGGAGMQLPPAPPLQTGGAALAVSPAKGMLPPMHVIEG